MYAKVYELRFAFPQVGNYEQFFSYPPSEWSVRKFAETKLQDHPAMRDAIVDALAKVNVEELNDGDVRKVRFAGVDVGHVHFITHHCWQ